MLISAGSAHEQCGWFWKLASKPCSSATVHRNSRANFVAQQPIVCRSKGKGTPEQTFELKMPASSRATSRKQEPRPHYYEQGPPSPRPQCIISSDRPGVYSSVHIFLYTFLYNLVYQDPRPHYEDLAKNLPAGSPDFLQMAPAFAFLHCGGEPIFGQISKVGASQFSSEIFADKEIIV